MRAARSATAQEAAVTGEMSLVLVLFVGVWGLGFFVWFVGFVCLVFFNNGQNGSLPMRTRNPHGVQMLDKTKISWSKQRLSCSPRTAQMETYTFHPFLISFNHLAPHRL